MRRALAFCLLSLPAAAMAQEGAGLTLISGPVNSGSVNVADIPGITIYSAVPGLTATFTPVLLNLDMTVTALPLTQPKPVDMSGALYGPLQQNPALLAPVGAPRLMGEAPALMVEAEGIRMPDEQFSLD